jgi:AbrB family looped-hinge helix DNA binding protein
VETIKVGKRGTVVIPAALRQQYNIDEGTLLMAESRDEGILLRPAAVFPVEIYTPERKAQFLLNTAVTPEDYAWAAEEVRKLGLDPDQVSHSKP